MASGDEGTRRLSFGGRAVEDSLRIAGVKTLPPTTALTETARPRPSPHKRLLVQNAWTQLPATSFRELARPYPASMVARHKLRRIVSALNVARAETVVALSETMGALARDRGAGEVMVKPVTLPLSMRDSPPVQPTLPGGIPPVFWLIPGTITWYKDCHWIVRHHEARLGAGLPPVNYVLAGTDDGSGCLEALLESPVAPRLTWGPVSRGEMTWLLHRAEVTVVPSRLESLSFSFAEAVFSSESVMASKLPVHLELASRLNIEPTWLCGEPVLSAEPMRSRRDIDWGQVATEWRELGRALDGTF